MRKEHKEYTEKYHTWFWAWKTGEKTWLKVVCPFDRTALELVLAITNSPRTRPSDHEQP